MIQIKEYDENAFKGYQIKFDNITCVKKSFPDFFQQIERLGFQQIAQ